MNSLNCLTAAQYTYDPATQSHVSTFRGFDGAFYETYFQPTTGRSLTINKSTGVTTYCSPKPGITYSDLANRDALGIQELITFAPFDLRIIPNSPPFFSNHSVTNITPSVKASTVSSTPVSINGEQGDEKMPGILPSPLVQKIQKIANEMGICLLERRCDTSVWFRAKYEGETKKGLQKFRLIGFPKPLLEHLDYNALNGNLARRVRSIANIDCSYKKIICVIDHRNVPLSGTAYIEMN